MALGFAEAWFCAWGLRVWRLGFEGCLRFGLVVLLRVGLAVLRFRLVLGVEVWLRVCWLLVSLRLRFG